VTDRLAYRLPWELRTFDSLVDTFTEQLRQWGPSEYLCVLQPVWAIAFAVLGLRLLDEGRDDWWVYYWRRRGPNAYVQCLPGIGEKTARRITGAAGIPLGTRFRDLASDDLRRLERELLRVLEPRVLAA